MEMTRVKRLVLELLFTRNDVNSVDAWRDALRLAVSPAGDGVEEPPEGSATDVDIAQVLEAVEQIVPHLSDYKTFFENLCSLLKFCEQECSHELLIIVCKWLSGSSATMPSTVTFRHWLYEYVDDVSERMLEVDACKWKQALLLAALKEEDATLKLTLLQLIDRKIGSLDGVVAAQDSPLSQQLRLLAFYWKNAAELSLSTALCASKFSGTTTSDAMDIEAVVVFLKWAREFQPLFFNNFANLVVEMKVFPRIRQRILQLPPAIGNFIQSSSQLHASVLLQLRASQKQICLAFEERALHIQSSSGCSAKSALPATVSGDQDSRLGEASVYLAHDLSVLHKDVFPHALAVYVSITASTREDTTLESVVDCIQGLLSVAALRSDASSLFFLLAAVIDLRLASHSVWLHRPQFFEQTIDDLSEQFILESNKAKKWTHQILLIQLLLECDVKLLVPRREWLVQRLPSSIYRIIQHRIEP